MLRVLRPFVLLAVIAGATLLNSCASNERTNQTLQAYVGITSVMPRNDSTGVSVLAPGVASFQDDVDAKEAAVMSWTLRDADGQLVPGSVDIQATRGSFTPTSALAPNTAYRYSLTTGVRMERGQIVRDIYEWSFTTGGAAPAIVR